MRLLTLTIGIILIISCAKKDEDQIAKLFDENRYRQHIATLSSDEFGGRAPASEGETLTIDYLTKEFTALGLLPANDGNFTQEVPLASIELTNTPDLIIKGQGEDLVFKHSEEHMTTSRQQDSEVDLVNSDLVFVGYGINAPERNWNDYAGVDVKGKTVVMLVNDPGFATQDPALFNGNAMTYYGRWTYKFDEAGKQGAAGAIIVHDTKPAAYPWAIVQNSWSGKQFHIKQNNSDSEFSLVESWVTLDVAKQLFAKAGMDFDKLSQAARTPGFRAVNLNLNASIHLENSIEETQSSNLVAYIPGSEKPEESFIFSAHWDHLGTSSSLEGDKIFNGAIDNATGTAALLELAAAFKASGIAPKRSVIFLATTAEEQGLLGSAFYANHPLLPIDKTVAGLNMDALRAIGKTRDIVVVGHGFSELDKYLLEAASRQGRVIIPDPKPENGYYFRSDHFSLAKKGVPMMYAKGGDDHVEHGSEFGKSRLQEYTEKHYHQVSDEYSEDWDVSGIMQDLALFYDIARQIVDSDDWPQWSEDSEFKNIRQAASD